MARNFRERLDLNKFSNNELQDRYRVNHGALQHITNEVDNILRPKTERNHSFSSTYKVLVTLRYLATGNIQLNTGDLHNIAQSSVSRIIKQTLDALSCPQMIHRHVQFPTMQADLQQNKEGFYHLARFPNVIGLIDGTQIQIIAPTRDEAIFVNRMGYHSINTQVVFDHEDRIIDIVARWPGSTHDSRVLRESGLWQLLEGRILPAGDHYLLGDSGYPCKRWLMTPYLHPGNNSKEQYNRSHKITRSKVERGIGQLKRRWGILQGEVRLSPEKTCKVIMACAVLHNICKAHNVPAPDAFPQQYLNAGNQNAAVPQDGLRYRDFICNQYF